MSRKTDLMLTQISMSATDQRKVVKSYASYIRSKNEVFRNIASALVAAQLELAVRETDDVIIDDPFIGISDVDLSEVEPSDLNVCKALLDGGDITVVTFEGMVSGLSLGQTLSMVLPTDLLQQASISPELLAEAYVEKYGSYVRPTPEFVADFDVNAWLTSFNLTDTTVFATQSGEIFNVRDMLVKMKEQQYLPDGLIKDVTPLVGSPRDIYSIIDDIVITNQLGRSLEVGMDMLANVGTVSVADLYKHMETEFGHVLPAVGQFVSNVASSMSDTFVSILDRVNSLLAPVSETDDVIDNSNDNGLIFAVSDDFSGASPTAAWASQLNVNFTGVTALVVGTVNVVKTTVKVLVSAVKGVFTLVKKGIDWIADNVINARDIYVANKDASDRSIDVPCYQGQFNTSSVISFLRSHYNMTNMTDNFVITRFGGGSKALEVNMPFATIKIFMNADTTQVVMSLAPTNALPDGDDYFKKGVQTPSNAASVEDNFKILFTGETSIEDSNAPDEKFYEYFKASMIRLIFWEGLMRINLTNEARDVSVYNYNNVSSVGGVYDEFGPLEAHFGFMEDRRQAVLAYNAKSLYANHSSGSTNLDFIHLMTAHLPVSTVVKMDNFPAGLFGMILMSSSVGQQNVYNDTGYFSPFIPFLLVNSSKPPMYGLRTDSENSKIITKILVVAAVIAVGVTVGIKAFQLKKSWKAKLYLMQLENEQGLAKIVYGRGDISDPRLSKIALKLRKKARKIALGQRLLGMTAPAAAAAGFSVATASDSLTGGMTALADGQASIKNILG